MCREPKDRPRQGDRFTAYEMIGTRPHYHRWGPFTCTVSTEHTIECIDREGDKWRLQVCLWNFDVVLNDGVKAAHAAQAAGSSLRPCGPSTA